MVRWKPEILETHQNACRIATSNLFLIWNICKYIDRETCQILVSHLVMSHLDYCNGILTGCHEYVVKILQRVQNMAAKVVLNQSKYSSTTQTFQILHWLPIREQIDFKLLCIVWKGIHGMSPQYLTNLLCKNNFEWRNLCSSDKKDILILPWVKNTLFAYRSFSVIGPRKWNALPNSICEAMTLEKFKSKLKIYYCSKIFN